MPQRTPQTIAAHLRLILAPAVMALEPWLGHGAYWYTRKIIGCASMLSDIDLHAIAASLAEQRAQASAGRPRGEQSGKSRNVGTSTTEDIALELHRIRSIGLDLQEAIDRLHPDPTWPTIASGARHRTSTATEHLTITIAEVRANDPGADLDDAITGLIAATRSVIDHAKKAQRTRAWPRPHMIPTDIDPPDPELEAAKCTSWPLGVDKDGQPIRCGNYRGMFPRHNPHTGTEQHSDLCDSCVALLCSQCWTNKRRTPGAKECARCEIANRRQRAA